MNALEGHVLHHADQLAVFGRGDDDVLGTNHDVHRGVGAEALVHALQLSAQNAHAAVAHHYAVEDVCLADKVRDKGVDRLVIDVLGRADLLDNAVVHHHHAVAHGQSFLLVVGDIDKGFFGLLLDFLQLELHAFAQLEVERAERLVQQNNIGIANQRARNGNALLLTAGKLCHRAFFITLEVNDGKHFHYFLFDFVFRKLFELQPKGNVIKHVQVGEQRILLKDGVDIPLVRRKSVNALAVKDDVAAVRLNKAADDAQRCGFAAAAGTENRNEFLFVNIKVDIIEDNLPVKADKNVL